MHASNIVPIFLRSVETIFLRLSESGSSVWVRNHSLVLHLEYATQSSLVLLQFFHRIEQSCVTAKLMQHVCSPLLVGSLQLPEEECSVVSSALSLRVNRAKNVLRSTFG